MGKKERQEGADDDLQRLHFILGAAQLGTWEWDVGSGAVSWSDELLAIHGRQAGGFDGTFESALADVHPDDRDKILQAINATLESAAPYHVEYRIITPEQTVRWLEAKGCLTRGREGQPRKFHGVCMDVTERKRLYEARSHLASLVESSDDAIVAKSLDGTIQSWNAAAERLFGYTAEQAVGRHISLIIPAERADEEERILASLRAGRRIEHYDTVRQRSDGRLVDVSLTISPIRDEAGQVVGASKIARDITQRKRTEAALRESERRLRILSESLEQKVAARTTDLQCQTARLQRLACELISAEQRERKRLAAVLHDDLQQLLVAAQLRVAQVHRQVGDSEVSHAVESAAELLAKAIDASRTLTYQLGPPVLQQAGFVSALRWLAGELRKLHELHVTIDAEDSEPALREELKVMLFQSVRELLFNVTKHAGVNAASVRVRRSGERLEIVVEDKGKGFDVERVANEEENEGRGLGLFSTRERLAALYGDMTIDSSPGLGTSIRLTAPLSARPGDRATPGAAVTPKGLR